jgi:hypothetical protein
MYLRIACFLLRKNFRILLYIYIYIYILEFLQYIHNSTPALRCFGIIPVWTEEYEIYFNNDRPHYTYTTLFTLFV